MAGSCTLISFKERESGIQLLEYQELGVLLTTKKLAKVLELGTRKSKQRDKYLVAPSCQRCIELNHIIQISASEVLKLQNQINTCKV